MSESQGLQPDWDLTGYFSALGAKDYLEFRDALSMDVASLQSRARALATLRDDREAWIVFLADLEDASARFQHLESYLGCICSANARDEQGQREESSLAGLSADFSKVMVVVRAAFAVADDDAFDLLRNDPRLTGAHYFLQRTRARAAVAMAPDLEELAADLGVDGIAAWGRLYDRLSGSLEFDLVVDGKDSQRLPVSVARSLLEDADPALRRAALVGSGAAWEQSADSVAASLNAISGTRLSLYRRRGIEHFLEPALFDAGIERRTLDAMLSVVRSRQNVAQRFLLRKAKLLGMQRLGFQDLSAPLPGMSDARISWDAAAARVRDTFSSAYPALGEFAGRAIDARWIDHTSRPGKRPGGFCTSSPVAGESRIFMTFNGAMGDAQTLAHELGHAFHSWLMKDMRWWSRGYPMTLAETASTFAEQLVTDAMLASEDLDDRGRAAILDARLQDSEAFLLNIPMRFDFERNLYEQRGDGELTVSQLVELMLDAQRSNYGDALDPNQLDPWFWASKLHFYITDISFYNFPYTFGYLFSMGIFARFKAEGASFLPTYESLLRQTGSAPAEQVARDALGVDLAGPDFWNASIDLIEADLARFEALTQA